MYLYSLADVMQALVSALKAREDAVAGNERRLDADRQALQQQRQDAELAGMKAQLAMPQATPQLSAAPRSVSRLQVTFCCFQQQDAGHTETAQTSTSSLAQHKHFVLGIV